MENNDNNNDLVIISESSPHVIDLDEVSSDSDVEITEVRPLTTNVLHAPGNRTFPLRHRLQRQHVRSFPNVQNQVTQTTRIRTRSDIRREYLQRQSRLRQRQPQPHPHERLQILNFGFPIFNFRQEPVDAFHDEERETEFWINRIQQLEQEQNDERVAKRLKSLTKFEKLLNAKLNKQTNYSIYNKIESDKKPVCLQCGVELGEGIPSAENQNQASLLSLIKKYHAPAPYQYSHNFSDQELLNSKKIFYNKNCGHLYCGRCIQIFGKPLNQLKKKKITISEDETYNIYENDKPILKVNKCVAQNCNANLNKLIEIYF